MSDKGTPKSSAGTPEHNPFGGKNPLGLYVPMSEDEQEVVARLVEADDLELIIHGWTKLEKPTVQFGDLRICVVFRMDFSGTLAPLYYLDLELRTRTGLSLFRQRMPLQQNGQPIMIGQGIFLDLAWDIAIDHMDPQVVKMIKPRALGLTSRRLDKDTKERTERGNMRLTEEQQTLLKVIDEGAAKIRAGDAQLAVEVTKKSGQELKETSAGLVAPDEPTIN
jgi:hypothetical protein